MSVKRFEADSRLESCVVETRSLLILGMPYVLNEDVSYAVLTYEHSEMRRRRPQKAARRQTRRNRRKVIECLDTVGRTEVPRTLANTFRS